MSVASFGEKGHSFKSWECRVEGDLNFRDWQKIIVIWKVEKGGFTADKRTVNSNTSTPTLVATGMIFLCAHVPSFVAPLQIENHNPHFLLGTSLADISMTVFTPKTGRKTERKKNKTTSNRMLDNYVISDPQKKQSALLINKAKSILSSLVHHFHPGTWCYVYLPLTCYIMFRSSHSKELTSSKEPWECCIVLNIQL